MKADRDENKGSERPEVKLGDTLANLYYAARRDYQIDLTHRAIRVLQFISFHPQPPRLDEVRAYLGCAPSTASELIKRLQKKGLLTRTRSQSDERAIAIELTNAGEKAVAEHTSLDPEKLKVGMAKLSTKDQLNLVQSLETMMQGLGQD